MTIIRHGNTCRILACLTLMAATAPATAATPPRLADFGFDMDNTSPAPTTPVEQARLAALDSQLVSALQASGLYQVLDMGKQAASLRASTLNIRDCNGCERPDALKQNASLAAYGWIQKVSNLILNINLVVEDARTGKQIAGGSVDIRGNTDESWNRGLKFLLEEHVLPAKP
jgi:hypothetical protein